MKGPLAAILLLPGLLAQAGDVPVPVGNAPAAAVPAPDAGSQARADVAGYVGVITTVVTPALRSQLDLPPGIGVIVEAVDADSPAARAGLTVHDVVTKLDDQWVVNVPQFSVLVRLHRPGTTVRLSIYRRGEAVVVPVRLGEKAIDVLDAPVAPRLLATSRPDRSGSIVTHSDASHRITLTTRGDDRRVTVTDPAGTPIYDGPLNTPEDREKLPASVREKVETVERNWARYQQLRGTISGAATAPTTPSDER